MCLLKKRLILWKETDFPELKSSFRQDTEDELSYGEGKWKSSF